MAKKYFAQISDKLKIKKWNITIFYSAGNSVGVTKRFYGGNQETVRYFGFKMNYIPVTTQFYQKLSRKTLHLMFLLFKLILMIPYLSLPFIKSGEDEYVKLLYDAKLESLYANALKAENLE